MLDGTPFGYVNTHFISLTRSVDYENSISSSPRRANMASFAGLCLNPLILSRGGFIIPRKSNLYLKILKATLIQ